MSYQVVVGRSDFAAALTRLGKVAGRAAVSEISLELDGSELLLSAPGATLTAKAAGTWPGRVRTSGTSLIAFAKETKGLGDLTIAVRDGKLRLDGISISCTVDEREGTAIDIPINATLGELVRLTLVHSPDELDRAGLTRRTQDALRKRDGLIESAAKTLHPLDIDETLLKSVIDDELRRRYGK